MKRNNVRVKYFTQRSSVKTQALKAPTNEETLLRKQCFLGAQTRKHLLSKQHVSEQIQKHFCFHNKCFLRPQTGKQCFRNNISSFAGALMQCYGSLSNVNKNIIPKYDLALSQLFSRSFRLVYAVQYRRTILQLDGHERF